MKVKPNIGIVNSLVRITLGLTVLSWSTAKLVKKPWKESYIIIAMLGAMKVAEGILKYCPVTDLAQSYTRGNQDNQHSGKRGDNNKSSNRQQEKPQLKQFIDTFIPQQDHNPNSSEDKNN